LIVSPDIVFFLRRSRAYRPCGLACTATTIRGGRPSGLPRRAHPGRGRPRL